MQMLNSINNIKIAKYFRLSEFACPCCRRVMLHPKLLGKLTELRNILERPVYITSGYRFRDTTGKWEECQTAITVSGWQQISR